MLITTDWAKSSETIYSVIRLLIWHNKKNKKYTNYRPEGIGRLNPLRHPLVEGIVTFKIRNHVEKIHQPTKTGFFPLNEKMERKEMKCSQSVDGTPIQFSSNQLAITYISKINGK